MLLLAVFAGVLAAVSAQDVLFVEAFNGTVTLVHLDDPGQYCQLPDYPEGVRYQSSMGMIEDKLLVSCGGWRDGVQPFPGVVNECYTFNGTTWTKIQDTTNRFCTLFTYTQSVYVPGLGFWMWGPEETLLGDCTNDMVSELLTIDGEWIPGPESPYGDYVPDEVCAVQLNETHTMLTGGWYNHQQLDSTWIYDWRTSQWSEAAPMLEPRFYHGCSKMADGNVIVAGGDGRYGNGTWSVEIFDISTQEWREEAPLPQDEIIRPYWNHVFTAGQDVYFIMHDSDVLYKRSEAGAWSLVPDIKLPRHFDGMDDFMIPVPEGFASC